MNFPKIISDLLNAQAGYDSIAYADYFSETAVVFDEGETHEGRAEIRQWNEKTNAKYRMVLEPITFFIKDEISTLTTKVSGTFDGSPIVLKYHFKLKDGQIDSLKITS